MVSNKIVKDESIRVLLNRREEILNTINSLETEYKAIGDILTRVHHLELYKLENEKRKAAEEER